MGPPQPATESASLSPETPGSSTVTEALATAEGAPRRRESWSIRRIAEEIGGRPIAEFQNSSGAGEIAPFRTPVSESLPPRRAGHRGGAIEEAGAEVAARPPAGDLDPIERVYPPLTRSTGRALHGAAREHHAETLETVRAAPQPPEPGRRPHLPGPSTRPERIYLHYLLLHLDRLSDHALTYLAHAVREELEARRGSSGDGL